METKRKTLVTEGKILVTEGKTLVTEGKTLVTEGKTLLTGGKGTHSDTVTKGKPRVQQKKVKLAESRWGEASRRA